MDVLDSPLIHTIHIYQRVDCCHDRNVNLQVYLNGETVQCAAEENYSVSTLATMGSSLQPLVFLCDSMVAAKDITVKASQAKLAILEIEATTAVQCDNVCTVNIPDGALFDAMTNNDLVLMAS